MDLLLQAVAVGSRDVEVMQTGVGLDPLRRRHNFRFLMFKDPAFSEKPRGEVILVKAGAVTFIKKANRSCSVPGQPFYSACWVSPSTCCAGQRPQARQGNHPGRAIEHGGQAVVDLDGKEYNGVKGTLMTCSGNRQRGGS